RIQRAIPHGDLLRSPGSPPPGLCTLSLHDALPICGNVTITAAATDDVAVASVQFQLDGANLGTPDATAPYSITWDTSKALWRLEDRKSTRLNSSHVAITYAVFCMKKKDS